MKANACKANKANGSSQGYWKCAAIRPNGTFTTLKRALIPQPAFCLLMPLRQLGTLGPYHSPERIARPKCRRRPPLAQSV